LGNPLLAYFQKVITAGHLQKLHSTSECRSRSCLCCEQALKYRKEGNAHFIRKDYRAAMASYLNATKQCQNDVYVITNLVATSVRLEKYPLAVTPPPPQHS